MNNIVDRETELRELREMATADERRGETPAGLIWEKRGGAKAPGRRTGETLSR